MRHAWWTRAWQAPQLLGGVLCAALGLRIMIVAVGEARAARAAAPAPETEPALRQLAEQISAPAEEIEALPAPAPAPEVKSLRLFLSVVVGPERSEVFVNGARLGLSPYLGDFTCKQGESLAIDIVPVERPLITRRATCAGKTVLIRD